MRSTRRARAVPGSGEVVVLRVALDARPRERAELETVLSEDERRRADRFRFAVDRERFVVARARLRHVLAACGAGPAERIRFGYGRFGKPALPAHPALAFNLSHAGDLALVAVAWRREVGVDLERLDPDRRLDDVARRFFSSVERRGLERIGGADRAVALLRCWCRKEAYLKARGDGLTRPLDSFDVAIGEPVTAAASLLRATRPDGREAAAWDLRDLDVGAGYVAAVALRDAIRRVSVVRSAGANETT
jgi:4'-phosphopantetheinyl transferase